MWTDVNYNDPGTTTTSVWGYQTVPLAAVSGVGVGVRGTTWSTSKWGNIRQESSGLGCYTQLNFQNKSIGIVHYKINLRL